MLKKNIYIAISLLLLLAAFTFPDWFAQRKSELDLLNFQKQLIKKESLLDNTIKVAFENFNQADFDKKTQFFFDLNKHEDITILIYSNDTLKFWNQDELQINDELKHFSDGVYRLANGWYFLKKLEGNENVIGLLKIMSEYSYQNKHIQTKFTESFQFQTIERISENEKGKSITDQSGNVLFYIESQPVFASSDYQALIFFFSYILSILFLLQATRFKNQILESILKMIVLISYRLLLYFLSPEFLEYVEFFRPNWYAINDWIPSFADFIINSILIFYLTIELNKLLNQIRFKYLFILKNGLAVLLGILTVEWVSSSIINSTYSYNLVNFFEWNFFSFCSLAGFALLFLASCNLVYPQSQKKLSISEVILWLAFALLISVIICGWQQVNIYHFWTLIPIISIRYINLKSLRSILIIGNLVYLAMVASFLISEHYKEREETKKDFIVKKLAEEKDVVAEYLFQSIDSLIKNDESIKELLFKDKYDIKSVSSYLSEKYFSGYWNKYSIIYYPCFDGDTILLNNEYALSCFDYYHDRIKYEGEKIASTSFYQLNNLAGRIDYLAELNYKLRDSTNINLYIELSSSIVNQFVGYPELLIDERSNSNHIDFTKYSYAVYHQQNLVFKSGAFNYPIVFNQSLADSLENHSFINNGYSHMPFKKNKETTIVLSEKEKRITDYFTRLAYLLVLFSFLVFVLSVFPFDFNLKIILNWNDFASRIQAFLLSTLFFAVSLFLVGTLFYIQKQNEEKNNKVISEKLRSVRVEMESKVGGEKQYNDSLITYYNALLIKFSNVFYTDINLFDNNGELFATSRPEIFEKGLKSRRIHPQAFKMLVDQQKSEWVQKETIGSMEYISAYVPIRNDYDKILGYLNLPYFAKQEELETEISDFFVSTINIYVAIFALALFISVLLVNQLSRPLSLIRQQISRLKLGGELELIEWKGNDEIGSLVKEYNRMVVELSDSVERLTQSEREGAWREMAKQVAHEIKNPLTPMKLSIQHLQMAYEKNADDLDSRIKKTTQTLIEQIDTLTNIANEFSHFAKMPDSNLKSLNLLNTIENAIHLYDTYEDVEIFIETSINKAIVKGDEDQLIRLFNNLFKNSIQAKIEAQQLRIKVIINQIDSSMVIDVADNGTGIPEDKREKIFEPNFTTKSSGTGLGLAMSRNILNNMGGTIKLLDSENGAHFRIQLPLEDKELMV